MSTAVLDSAVVAGVNDAAHCATGWHERTVDGGAGIPHRPASADALLRLLPHPEATRLWLLLAAPVGVCGQPMEVTLHLNETAGIPVRFTRDTWQLVPLVLPHDLVEISIRIHSANPLIPDRVLGNGDGRAIGCYLAAAWQE